MEYLNKKNSFLLYNSDNVIFSNLTDEEAGQLIKAIFNYETTSLIPTLDNTLYTLFMIIKQKLDINRDNWEITRQQRSEAGKKGMANRWNNKE